MSNLRRTFGAVLALDGFSLKVEPSELVALLGPSGSGKTTALRVLAGLEVADYGRIVVGNKDVTHLPAHRRDMGMVFQAYSLFPNMTASENVAFGLRIRRVGAAMRKRRASELLELTGLSSEANRYPHQLSGGQQQRVALARALAIEPSVLLLDEPLSALDAAVRSRLRDEIRRIQLEVGTTTVFVTHDQEEALSIADRVGVMKDGRLQQVGTPFQIYNEPANAFVASFVGSVNRLPGIAVDRGCVQVLGAIVHPSAAGSGLSWPPGTPVEVLVRPEALSVERDSVGSCRLTSRTFLGAMLRVGVSVPGHKDSLFAMMPAAEAGWAVPGEPVRLTLSGTPLFVTESSGEPAPSR
ncbi:MAG: ABC transporter ATP-binding protein [Actinobacteria bacterium]|nr:ABC transporter ATP-binding protein [Actinomycetota bacterium]MCL5445973.1 ABC transporter ATP-binding protein [Actinomycetota bacterium]